MQKYIDKKMKENFGSFLYRKSRKEKWKNTKFIKKQKSEEKLWEEKSLFLKDL